jgi:hypothetical protein
MMKGLQGLAADSRANPYARMIARALCLLAFGGFREEQTHLFGVLAISTHNGRATMYCKTKRKARDAPTEYGIVPLSGITDDDGAWMQGGENLMATLPGDADFFLPGLTHPRERGLTTLTRRFACFQLPCRKNRWTRASHMC